MNFIDRLYEGNIMPFENKTPATDEYLRKAHALVKCEKRLYTLLSDEALELFKSYIIISDNINYTLNKENFRAGFCLGAQMMIDIIKSDEKS